MGGIARQQLRHRPREHALAGARLPDNAECAPLVERKTDAIDGAQAAARGCELDRHLLDCQQWGLARSALRDRRVLAGPIHHSAAWRGSVIARKPSPTTLKASTVKNRIAAGR